MTQLVITQAELKPCPFCGCHGLSAAYPRIIRDMVCGVVECHTDGCYAMVVHDTLPQAIKAWNRRQASTDYLVEALERCADSLEAEIRGCFPLAARNGHLYPSERRRFERDMQDVVEARAAIAKARGHE